MAQEIIGREPEIKEIEALYQTNKPVFAVIYGRRRVGKTFLIRELLGDKLYSSMNFHGWIHPVLASLPPWNIFGMDGEQARRT